MEGDIFPQTSGYEVEFRKRLRIMTGMLAHLEGQENLLSGIRHEGSIPESARGMAVGAIEEEISVNKKIFNDFLVDYISYCMQGLHRMDIGIEFSYIASTQPKISYCTINIDGTEYALPPDSVSALVDRIVEICGEEGDQFPARLIALYEKIEGYYDLLLGADLDRCSLLLNEELFPSSCFHVSLKLPAPVMMEQDLGRWTDS